MEQKQNQNIGVVGLGLMGTSIVTCLLASGHQVVGIDRELIKVNAVQEQIKINLTQLRSEGLLETEVDNIMSNFQFATKLEGLVHCDLIVETITENLEIKIQLLTELESIVSPAVVIGSNTSAIPVSLLQKDLKHPERIIGLHWAEPAHITKFMEIVCGDQTDLTLAKEMMVLVERWGKEPSLLQKDIKGFITNRIMYAMLREAFYLVENGYASIESVDRSLRNDLGYWISFAGPFRFMDLTGIPAYLTVMEDLFPDLDRSTAAPKMMQKLVDSGAKGVDNAQGFYPYTEESANKWKEDFTQFSYDIRKLTEKYSSEND
ncbi:3-hydroxyacyl-CoA dehydrogenase family protein [Membranihabitans marinus]|uniref:3-hydroxyacyl-CoA dehydrogenase family protein n=1 Tax=Membranihabitans marinus TaxID=1227546 RepID=UPI001F2B31B1|nr:3-hydroxyacyl-CoA dehydrogenase family protein [Membranihabitans marinus]